MCIHFSPFFVCTTYTLYYLTLTPLSIISHWPIPVLVRFLDGTTFSLHLDNILLPPRGCSHSFGCCCFVSFFRCIFFTSCELTMSPSLSPRLSSSLWVLLSPSLPQNPLIVLVTVDIPIGRQTCTPNFPTPAMQLRFIVRCLKTAIYWRAPQRTARSYTRDHVRVPFGIRLVT